MYRMCVWFVQRHGLMFLIFTLCVIKTDVHVHVLYMITVIDVVTADSTVSVWYG